MGGMETVGRTVRGTGKQKTDWGQSAGLENKTKVGWVKQWGAAQMNPIQFYILGRDKFYPCSVWSSDPRFINIIWY